MDTSLPTLEEQPGIVLYTLVDRVAGRPAGGGCKRIGIPCVSVLEPMLQLLQNYLGAPDARRIGAQHVLDTDYFRRIDALNFTMMHDDGQLAGALDEADVVLVGISRTSKTPTSDLSRQPRHQDRQHPDRSGIALPAELEEIKRP